MKSSNSGRDFENGSNKFAVRRSTGPVWALNLVTIMPAHFHAVSTTGCDNTIIIHGNARVQANLTAKAKK